MVVKRVETIYISSKNRTSGEIYDFDVTFNTGQLKADNNQQTIKMTVIHACINRSYYTVEEGAIFTLNTLNNVTLFSTNSFSIESGYYNVDTFRTYLLSVLIGWIITYNTSKNIYTFKPPNDGHFYSFSFENCSNLFGFNVDTTDNFEFNSPISSNNIINMNADNSIYVHTTIPRKAHACYHNFTSSKFRECNILCSIPMVYGPYNNMNLDLANQFVYYLSCQEVSTFRLYVTDQNNIILKLKIDWTIALKFEFIEDDENDMLNVMNQIKDFMQYNTMRKLLK